MLWADLVGKKVLAFRGYKTKLYGKETITLSFILFDDKETYLELNEQDPYSYHDACNSARTLFLWKDADRWQRMFNKEGFEEPKLDVSDPFC